MVKDIMLGTPSVINYLPQIYFETALYGYRIEIINWNNHVGDAWISFPTKDELFGKPVLHVQRIELSLKPDTENFYSFITHFSGPDSLNSEGGFGWYSTISQEHLDELLSLTSSVCIENAEVVLVV